MYFSSFLFIEAPVAFIAADKPKGTKMFSPNEIAGLINFGKNLASIDPKAPTDFTNLIYLCFA